ncbi:uncharacterized protein LOC117334562 isoform X3 [Pecten maximus]|uniref:uncharacterized protein LOC117334562 isoform X3 n=1 Tax=Pecten maximus TaxID=6579 RepID=UPI0014588FAB|nr:uncharacterized protein LOC117334562 isoform X3 [Pecten maximus]
MAAKYQSTKETVNFARICRVMVDVVPDVFRDLLLCRLPASGLAPTLGNQKSQIFSQLNKQQKKILYPPVGMFVGSLKDLDVSLIYILLRNLGNIPPHQNGWGKSPDPADRSLSANIERLRIHRNEAYAHANTAFLSDGDFQTRWVDIRQSVEEIEKVVPMKMTFVTEIDSILTMRIDPLTETLNVLIKKLEDKTNDVKDQQDTTANDVDEIRGEISDIKDQHDTMATNVDNIKGEFDDFKGRQDMLKTGVANVKGEISDVKDRLDTIKKDMERHKERDPKMVSMIETTKNMINNERKSYQFIATKSFCDAREKLLKNRIVIIQGNTGDGKSSIAIELLRSLCSEEEQQKNLCRQPLELYDIKDLDSVAPKSQLVVYLDDIFGKNAVCYADVEEWEKRQKAVLSKFCESEHSESNFLVITIRSGILNSLDSSCLENIFTEQNIIDLNEYKDEKEKLELLRLYEPKDEFVKWTDDEEKEIIRSAPDIGFPQCCRLFRDTPALQEERLNFFRRPFHFMKSALAKLKDGKFYGLLYLFLNGGKLMENDLDPSSENINNKLLEAAFAVDVVRVIPTSELMYNKGRKPEFVKESLESLLGSLVKKEFTEIEGGFDSYYKFNHDSIEETVAFLYGEKTPIGYIQNCPSKFLSFLTTAKHTPNRIVISSYEKKDAMYKRSLKEFKSIDPRRYRYFSEWEYLVTLDVWNDTQFLQGYIKWLNGQNVDQTLCLEIKLALLNGACSIGSEECASYLLLQGVTPDKETPFFVVKGGSVDLLRKLLTYDITPTTRARRSRSSHYAAHINVLHEACLSEREEMVTLLCDTYPDLVYDTEKDGSSTLHLVVLTGNCSIFQTVERTVLKSLCRVEDAQHQCESEDGRVVHRNCACAQFMSQLIDKFGKTVLHQSCKHGKRELSLDLCKVYPTLTTTLGYKFGDTILHSCCRYGHRELFFELCKLYPALITVVDVYGRTVLHVSCFRGHRELCLDLCRIYPALTTVVDKEGKTFLHWSCWWRDVQLCVDLCKLYPALASVVDNEGRTVLHVCSEWGCTENCIDLCKLYPALITAVDNHRLTILHWSSKRGHRELCLQLCKSFPALTTIVDSYGWTILHWSCKNGHTELCLELCKLFPALTTIVDNDGRTVLFVSCEMRHMKLCLELCKLYPELITIADKFGKTILHTSCMTGQRELCLELCRAYPALTTYVDNKGRTILHTCCVKGHRKLCLDLCKLYPTLTTVVDKEGRTILHMCCMQRYKELCLDLCTRYPVLTTMIDKFDCHCLHYIAKGTSDVTWFTKCETHVQQYTESTGQKYDITTILSDNGRSVLDMAKEFKYSRYNPLYDHLVKLFKK